jgi:hypothetical protein
MVLWGSLNQLLIPFIAFAAFYYKEIRRVPLSPCSGSLVILST